MSEKNWLSGASSHEWPAVARQSLIQSLVACLDAWPLKAFETSKTCAQGAFLLGFLLSLTPASKPPSPSEIHPEPGTWLYLCLQSPFLGVCSFLKSRIPAPHRHSVLKAVVPSDQAEAWHYCISVPPRTGFSVYHTEGETAGFPKRALASSGNLGKIGLFRKAAEPPCLDGCGEVLGVGGHFVLCVKDGEVFVLMTQRSMLLHVMDFLCLPHLTITLFLKMSRLDVVDYSFALCQDTSL